MRTNATEKMREKIPAGIDLGINPLYTVYTAEGETFTEDPEDRKTIFKMKENIEKLETRIGKRKYDNTKCRTKKQYAGTTKRLKQKLEKKPEKEILCKF